MEQEGTAPQISITSCLWLPDWWPNNVIWGNSHSWILRENPTTVLELYKNEVVTWVLHSLFLYLYQVPSISKWHSALYRATQIWGRANHLTKQETEKNKAPQTFMPRVIPVFRSLRGSFWEIAGSHKHAPAKLPAVFSQLVLLKNNSWLREHIASNLGHTLRKDDCEWRWFHFK